MSSAGRAEGMGWNLEGAFLLLSGFTAISLFELQNRRIHSVSTLYRLQAFRPVPRPDRPGPEAVFKPDVDVSPSDGSRPPRESHRPPVVSVTDDGPPSKDFISQLEADLVAGRELSIKFI